MATLKKLAIKEKVSSQREKLTEFCILLFLILLASFRLYNLDGIFVYDYDEGVYLQTAKQFLNGYSLYDKIFFSQPPFFIYFIALFMLMLGKNVYAGRFAIAFSSILGGIATYFIVRKLTRSYIPAIASFMALMIDYLFMYYSRAVEGEVPCTVFSLFSILFIIDFLRDDKKIISIIASGFFLALAMLTKFFAASTAISIFLILFFSSNGNFSISFLKGKKNALIKAEDLVLFLTSAAIPVLFLLPLIDLKFAYAQLFMFHLSKPPGGTVLDKLRQLISYLSDDTGLILFGIVGFLTTIISSSPEFLLIPTWLLFSVLMLIFLPQPLWYHHPVIVIPPLAILFGLSLDFFIKKWKSLSIRKNDQSYQLKRFLLLCFFLLLLVVYSSYLPSLFNADKMLIFSRQNVQENEVIKLIDEVTGSNDWIISDDQLIVFDANRNVPPELCDTSFMRISSGYLTDKELIRLTEEYNVKVVIFWTNRLLQLSNFSNYVKENFILLKKYDENQLVYIRR